MPFFNYLCRDNGISVESKSLACTCDTDLCNEENLFTRSNAGEASASVMENLASKNVQNSVQSGILLMLLFLYRKYSLVS